MTLGYPQATYTGFTHYLLAEWCYPSRHIARRGQYLTPIKKTIHNCLILTLLVMMPAKRMREKCCCLLSNSAKHSRRAILNPTENTAHTCACSVVAREGITVSLLAGSKLASVTYKHCMREDTEEARKERVCEKELFC